MISILIADDDINKISSIINSIHNNYQGQINIKQASNVQESIELLQNNHFHLLISDLLMPLRAGEQPDVKGGENLIKNIYKDKNKINVPIYIIGLTQFEEVKNNFSAVWQVWKYDSSSNDWEHKLRDLVFHISRINSKILQEKKETIFVEGTTDKEILHLGFQLFFKEFSNYVSIETINFGAGSSWVERQLFIWGKTLFLKDKEKTIYLKAVGLFDNDESGNNSINSLKKSIGEHSAESKTFTTIKLDKKYAKHLIPIYQKGLTILITLEEMYSPFCWEYAQTQCWLIERNLSESMLQNPNKWDKIHKSLTEHVKSLELNVQEDLYVRFKINEECKVNLVKYIKALPIEEQKMALVSFQPLIQDILSKLKLNTLFQSSD